VSVTQLMRREATAHPGPVGSGVQLRADAGLVMRSPARHKTTISPRGRTASASSPAARMTAAASRSSQRTTVAPAEELEPRTSG
jgi:hypothetical protein